MECKAEHSPLSPPKEGIEIAIHYQILNNDLTIVFCVYEPFNITTWCVVIAFISELINVN